MVSGRKFWFCFSTSTSEKTIPSSENVQPLQLSPQISNIELIEAEQKTEEKKEIIMENQSDPKRPSDAVDQVLNRVWYNRPVSDEGDSSGETAPVKVIDIQEEKKMIAPDIDTSHSANVENETSNDKNKNIAEHEPNVPVPSWINDQVYGDKVSKRRHTIQYKSHRFSGYSIQSSDVQCEANRSRYQMASRTIGRCYFCK